jgi:hypothetical protein
VKINFENGPPKGMEQFPPDRWAVSASQAIDGLYSLEHDYDNSESAVDYVSFVITEPDPDSSIQIGFTIRYGYRPSGSNNWGFYLLSSGGARLMAEGEAQAFIMGVNQIHSDDSLTLYYQKQGQIAEIMKCNLNCETDMAYDPWEFLIEIDPSSGITVSGGKQGDTKTLLGKRHPAKIPWFYPSYTGLKYSYTSSKDRLLAIDDIFFSGKKFVDTIAPRLLDVTSSTQKIIKFSFSETIFPIDNNIAKNVFLSTPFDSAWIRDSSLLFLLSDVPQKDGIIHYELSGITDRKGNSSFYKGEFIYNYPQWHDILITEIMADPSPPVFLPELEYIEIFNRSENGINLKEWKLYTGDKSWILPAKYIESGEYHVFTTSGGETLISSGENISGLFNSESVLTNKEGKVVLLTPDGIVIDAARYSSSFFIDFKVEGGWSVERIDLENKCGGDEIWRPSEAPEGGTPGLANSHHVDVYDNDAPYIRQVIRENDSSFLLVFNEVLDKDRFSSDKAQLLHTNPWMEDIELVSPFYNSSLLTLRESSYQEAKKFENAFIDCEGNTEFRSDSLFLSTPLRPRAGSVLISEVLFSPLPNCPEFIELYNNSGQVLSLFDLKLKVNVSGEGQGRGIFISDKNILFPPRTYLVLCKTPDWLDRFYDIPRPMNYLKHENFPSLPDKGARIGIYNRGEILIDEMIYSPETHFPLLSDFHGVSLERVSLDGYLGTESDWHSASSLSGFATPGRVNSQNHIGIDSGNVFSAEFDVFSPNNDGYRDMAVINIKMDREGYLAVIRVFDPVGSLVRTLGKRELLGTEGKITWDGRDEEGRLCSTGIYLIHMETIHVSGGRKKAHKEVVVLGR